MSQSGRVPLTFPHMGLLEFQCPELAAKCGSADTSTLSSTSTPTCNLADQRLRVVVAHNWLRVLREASSARSDPARISRTVSGTIALPVLWKKRPITVSVSELYAKETRKPFVRSSPIRHASKASGRLAAASDARI